MGARFVLLVDTEEEFDWSKPPSRAARSVTATGALPAAHRRFRAWGVPVTYMVSHPVATDPRAAGALGEVLAEGGAGIGTHLHPWVNPPFRDAAEPTTIYPGALPRSLEAAKLDVLTDAVERATGVRPRAYRAGRYGIGPATPGLLAARGYVLDSSVRARYDYRSDGGPDFQGLSSHATWSGLDGDLIELPLTTVFTGRWRRRGPVIYPRAARLRFASGALARLGLLSQVALTPEDMSAADAMEAVRVAVGEGVRVLNFAFHSPSLVPGNTPYVRDAIDRARFWRWWEAVLALLDRLDVRAAALDEVIAAAHAAR